jgi:hypothetical protein
MAYNIDHEGDVKMHEEFHNRDDTTKGLQLKPKQLSQWKE